LRYDLAHLWRGQPKGADRHIAGARVRAVARNSPALSALAGRHSSIERWEADVTQPEFARELAASTCDILVNNAGRNTPLPMVNVSVEVLDAMMDLSVRATYLAS
jgi:NADP-dependent 3-hydroxy acid dehydrogenase YdfG